jgi:hypothetical protein
VSDGDELFRVLQAVESVAKRIILFAQLVAHVLRAQARGRARCVRAALGVLRDVGIRHRSRTRHWRLTAKSIPIVFGRAR